MDHCQSRYPRTAKLPLLQLLFSSWNVSYPDFLHLINIKPQLTSDVQKYCIPRINKRSVFPAEKCFCYSKKKKTKTQTHNHTTKKTPATLSFLCSNTQEDNYFEKHIEKVCQKTNWKHLLKSSQHQWLC